MKKAIIVNGDEFVNDIFLDHFNIMEISTNENLPASTFNQVDLVVFCGGTDISPAIYGEVPEGHTDKPYIERDLFEIRMVQRAIKYNKKVVGICRGAQLLNCLLGGALIQHDTSSKHLDGHIITFKDGDQFKAEANHHQLMLAGEEAIILASHDGVSEVLLYKDKRVLCWQPHPEWEYNLPKNPHYLKFIETINKL